MSIKFEFIYNKFSDREFGFYSKIMKFLCSKNTYVFQLNCGYKNKYNSMFILGKEKDNPNYFQLNAFMPLYDDYARIVDKLRALLNSNDLNKPTYSPISSLQPESNFFFSTNCAEFFYKINTSWGEVNLVIDVLQCYSKSFLQFYPTEETVVEIRLKAPMNLYHPKSIVLEYFNDLLETLRKVILICISKGCLEDFIIELNQRNHHQYCHYSIDRDRCNSALLKEIYDASAINTQGIQGQELERFHTALSWLKEVLLNETPHLMSSLPINIPQVLSVNS